MPPGRPRQGESRANADDRPKRTPVGVRNVLTYRQIPGYHTRIVNDIEDRIEVFKAAGYEPVMEHQLLGDPNCGNPAQIGSVVSKSVGAGRKGILMKIRQDWYDEDQAAKQKKVNQNEESLMPEALSKGLTSNLGPGQSLSGVKITR